MCINIMTNDEFRIIRRALLNLTPVQLGELMGMDKTRVSHLENGISGRKPTLQHAVAMKTLVFIKREGLLPKLTNYLKENRD